ncbi:hypothetical protein DFH27DRAFT_394592 [Peziza echinospora]|nr:hypothetical protein DFH27DRAFT_394592 [Peziza echinospora]
MVEAARTYFQPYPESKMEAEYLTGKLPILLAAVKFAAVFIFCNFPQFLRRGLASSSGDCPSYPAFQAIDVGHSPALFVPHPCSSHISPPKDHVGRMMLVSMVLTCSGFMLFCVQLDLSPHFLRFLDPLFGVFRQAFVPPDGYSQIVNIVCAVLSPPVYVKAIFSLLILSNLKPISFRASSRWKVCSLYALC